MNDKPLTKEEGETVVAEMLATPEGKEQLKDTLLEVFKSFPTEVSLGFADCEPGDPVEGIPEGLEPPKSVVLVLQFSEKGFGFGEVTLKQTPEGLFLDTECMSLDRVKRYFAMLLDKAIPDTDEDPKRHQLFNQVMSRSCGPGCPVCNPQEAP